MKKVLITGISGMIGGYLADHLTGLGHDVSGISRFTSDSRQKPPACNHYQGDILDTDFLKRVWVDVKPDVVYHLAAQAFNGTSWDNPTITYLTNIQGTLNVLNTCRELSPKARIIPACSSAEYGFIEEQPIKEEVPLNPVSPYGVTKACVEMMCRQHYYNYGLDVVIPRLFITLGTNHPPVTVVQNLAKQFAELSEYTDNILVENTKTSRDFIDIRDVVVALELLQSEGISGESYNVCSGVSTSISDLIKIFKEVSGKRPHNVYVSAKKSRPSDEVKLTGDNTKLRKLGWIPGIPLKRTIADIYNDWKKRCQYQ